MENQRNHKEERTHLSNLESIASITSGALSRAGLTAAFLYNPEYAAAAVAAVGAVCAVFGSIYLSEIPRQPRRKILRNFALSGILASASVLGGNYVGTANYSPQTIQQGEQIEGRNTLLSFPANEKRARAYISSDAEGNFIPLEDFYREQIRQLNSKKDSEKTGLMQTYQKNKEKLLPKKEKEKPEPN